MSTDGPELPDLAQLRTTVARLRNETEALRTSVEEIRDAARLQQQDTRAERDRALADLARAARNGELEGPGRRLAQRVDRGETSWLDILHQRDPSPDAVAVRQSAGTALEGLVEELTEREPDLRRRLGRDEGGPPRGRTT